MTWQRVFMRRLRRLFHRQRLERDLADEIRAHCEMQVEDNLRRGMNPAEARHDARRRFGPTPWIGDPRPLHCCERIQSSHPPTPFCPNFHQEF